MFDYKKEQVVNVSEIGSLATFANRNKKLSRATIERWITKGVKGTVLETIKIGGKRFTSIEAIGRFLSVSSASGTQESTKLMAAGKQMLKALEVYEELEEHAETCNSTDCTSCSWLKNDAREKMQSVLAKIRGFPASSSRTP